MIFEIILEGCENRFKSTIAMSFDFQGVSLLYCLALAFGIVKCSLHMLIRKSVRLKE